MVTKKQKKESKRRWFKGFIWLGILGFVTPWFMFFPAWWNRKKGTKSIFWGWMDDTRFDDNNTHGYSMDYYSFLLLNNKTEEDWKVAYKWHKRNGCWNFKTRNGGNIDTSFPNGSGNNNVITLEIETDNLHTYDGVKLDQSGPWIIKAGLKYIPEDPSEDIWQVMQGDEISKKTSIIGEGLHWYKLEDSDLIYFRYSQCKIVEYKILGIRIWKGWRTISMSTGQTVGMNFKHQAIKPWK
tara:strand:+ start:9103 stop:9819 length:717 start_codon:yes stop_codon:yes gene_type:complete